jgi:hypothetical protein
MKVNTGRDYRPSYARLGQNLKKSTQWKSIEVHAIYAVFFILGFSAEGLQVLKKFLNSFHDDIYDPLFLAQMVLSPLNSIVDELLLPQVAKEERYDWSKARNKKAKFRVMFRFDILCRMLGVLEEFGTEPVFAKQKFAHKLIKSKDFGINATGSGNHSPIVVTGFTAAFFLTLPELFIQWIHHKDGDGSKLHPYKILEFVGEQCLWPTFSKGSVGSMLSNKKSKKPYSFLPEIFHLRNLFMQCLKGEIEWKTTSLCEEPVIVESARKEQAKRKPEEDTAIDDNNDTAIDDNNDDTAPEEEQVDVEETFAEVQGEKDSLESKKATGQQQKKMKLIDEQDPEGTDGKQSVTSENSPIDIQVEIGGQQRSATNISSEIQSLLSELDEENCHNQRLKECIQEVANWNANSTIYAIDSSQDDDSQVESTTRKS